MTIRLGLSSVLQSFTNASRRTTHMTDMNRSPAYSLWRSFSWASACSPTGRNMLSLAQAGRPLQDLTWLQNTSISLQHRHKHGHKTKTSFSERIKKTASGLFVARHPHYRHKRYNKTKSQLNRLKGTFVLPKYMQRKLRKAGY